MVPAIGSAGCEANQFTTTLRSPDCERIFHSALLLREVLLTGRMPLPSGEGSTNPRMSCLSARLPVAIEFQRMGERIGCSVAICPLTPFSTNF
jgi:hypothetical protein